MKRISIILVFCFLYHVVPAQKQVHATKLDIWVNYNAELLGLAYFIGFEGVDIEKQTVEINGKTVPKKDWHRYGFYIYEKYKRYAASENLARSFTLAEHLWLDSILYLLIQVEDFPNARLTPGIDARYFIHFSKNNDTAEARQHAAQFLDGLNRFSKEINFGKYITETKVFYENAISQVKANLPRSDFTSTMERFYNKTFENYTLVPSLTIPKGMGFGLHVPGKEKTRLFNVFGAFGAQQIQNENNIDAGFADPQRLQELSIHEFGHSFVNPVIDSIPAEKIKETEQLFEPIKAAMEKQGYNTWKVCLYEHFVRAGEVMIADLLGDKDGAKKLREHYIRDRSFIYLPHILKELETYKISRESYSTVVWQAINGLLQQN